MARRRKHQPTDATFYRAAMRWMGIGIEFCAVIGLFTFGGYWLGSLEDKEGTSIGGMILGFFIGFGVMMYVIVKRAQSTQEELQTPPDDEEEEDIN